MDNDTGAMHQKKEQLYKELQDLGKQISSAITELKDRREKRNALTQLAQEQKTVRKDLSKVIKEKITEVKALRQKRGDKKVKDDHVSPGKLREEINKLERKIETSAMAFTEEQKLTKVLKEKKAQLAKIGGDSELDHTIRSLSKEIDKLKKESDVAHDKVTVAAKESQEHHEAILTLSKQIEEWKKLETVAKDQYQSLKAELQTKTEQLPVKKSTKKQSMQPSAEEVAVLKEKAAEVEQKVKEKKKLTTEDLLAFQANK